MTDSRTLPSASSIDVEGFVLAGGRSIRMGSDKALLQISGRPLIEITLRKLHLPRLALSSAPRIAGTRPDLASYAQVVDDIHPGCGPLGGIEAALAATAHALNLFLPVDLPFLPAQFLEWMLERAFITGASATFPRAGGRAQPLCAVYHRCLLAPISRSVAAGSYKVARAVLGAIRDCSPPGQSIDIFDIESVAAACPELHGFSPIPLHRWFENLNSPEDLAALRSLGKLDLIH